MTTTLDDIERRRTPITMVCVLFTLLAAWVTPARAADINQVINIIECESSGRYNVYGREDEGQSYGIAQFKRETFDHFKRRAGHLEWRYRNPIHQLRLMNWMLDHGYGSHWTCYRRLMGGIYKGRSHNPD